VHTRISRRDGRPASCCSSHDAPLSSPLGAATHGGDQETTSATLVCAFDPVVTRPAPSLIGAPAPVRPAFCSARAFSPDVARDEATDLHALLRSAPPRSVHPPGITAAAPSLRSLSAAHGARPEWLYCPTTSERGLCQGAGHRSARARGMQRPPSRHVGLTSAPMRQLGGFKRLRAVGEVLLSDRDPRRE
jgi:hypothetical protein